MAYKLLQTHTYDPSPIKNNERGLLLKEEWQFYSDCTQYFSASIGEN